jgi:NAD(P)-dependent dehydrogenase (short-subunit alcohol dehydrogenase family)
MDLTGKIALITGGTRGIGAATAVALAKDGADVAIVGRRVDDTAKGTRDKVLAVGRRCEIIQADCGIPAEAVRSVRETESRLGAPAVLVHSAGGPVNGGLLELTPEKWNAAFDVHVHAIFHLSRAVIPAMRARKEGSIILVSSIAGIRGVITNPAYQVVKGALPQFARALAREFADDNIRVNCIAPGIIRTDFHAAMSAEQKKLNLDHRIPLHREGTADQVATAIAELVKNDYITGEMLTVDGGITMRIA